MVTVTGLAAVHIVRGLFKDVLATLYTYDGIAQAEHGIVATHLTGQVNTEILDAGAAAGTAACPGATGGAPPALCGGGAREGLATIAAVPGVPGAGAAHLAPLALGAGAAEAPFPRRAPERLRLRSMPISLSGSSGQL